MKSTTEKAEAFAARHKKTASTAARSQWHVALATAVFDILEAGETLSVNSLWDKLAETAAASTSDLTKEKLAEAMERLGKFVVK